MNNKVKAIVYIIGFVSLIVVAVWGYNYLTERYRAPNNLNNPPATDGDYSTEDPSQKDNTNNSEEPLEYLNFTVQDYDGNTVSLSDYIGKPIVLNFWASWCSPCKQEMPHFNKVSEEYLEDELLFLMVDLADGGRETVEKGKAYVEDNNFTFPVLFDTKRDAATTYAVRGIPTTYVINKDGHILWGSEGAIDEETLREAISLIIE